MEPLQDDTFEIQREKIQLERERLALERERLENERESYKHTVDLNNRAAGRVIMSAGAFALTLLCAMLVGVVVGGVASSAHIRANQSNLAASIAELMAADAADTNSLDSATGRPRLLRALDQRGRKCGNYLLILE